MYECTPFVSHEKVLPPLYPWSGGFLPGYICMSKWWWWFNKIFLITVMCVHAPVFECVILLPIIPWEFRRLFNSNNPRIGAELTLFLLRLCARLESTLQEDGTNLFDQELKRLDYRHVIVRVCMLVLFVRVSVWAGHLTSDLLTGVSVYICACAWAMCVHVRVLFCLFFSSTSFPRHAEIQINWCRWRPRRPCCSLVCVRSSPSLPPRNVCLLCFVVCLFFCLFDCFLNYLVRVCGSLYVCMVCALVCVRSSPSLPPRNVCLLCL